MSSQSFSQLMTINLQYIGMVLKTTKQCSDSTAWKLFPFGVGLAYITPHSE